jgi:membrane protein required for colicin V production
VNRIDLVLAIVLALFALRGFWRGFSREFFGFIGLIGGLAVAAATYATAATRMPASLPEQTRPIVAFAVVFGAIDLIANIVGALVHRLLGVIFLSPVNRLAGGVFGAVKGAALAAIGLLLVLAYAPSSAIEHELATSALARPLLAFAEDVGRDVRPPPDDWSETVRNARLRDHRPPDGGPAPRADSPRGGKSNGG